MRPEPPNGGDGFRDWSDFRTRSKEPRWERRDWANSIYARHSYGAWHFDQEVIYDECYRTTYFIEKQIAIHSRGKSLTSVSNIYMTVLLPATVGKPESHILFYKTRKAYEQNEGLDQEDSGKTTKAEAAARVADKLVVGMRPHNFG